MGNCPANTQIAKARKIKNYKIVRGQIIQNYRIGKLEL